MLCRKHLVRREGEGPGHPLSVPVASSVKMAKGFQPTAHFIYPLVLRLVQGVSSMPGVRPFRQATPGFLNKVLGIVVFVTADDDPGLSGEWYLPSLRRPPV